MRFTFGLTSFVAVVVFVTAAGCSQQPNGTVSGTVYAIDRSAPGGTRDPLPGYSVTLLDSDTGNPVKTETTDTNGTFVFSGIPTGEYSLSAGGRAQYVHVQPGQAMKIDLSVPKAPPQ